MPEYMVTYKAKLKGSEEEHILIEAKNKKEARKRVHEKYSDEYGITIKRIEEFKVFYRR